MPALAPALLLNIIVRDSNTTANLTNAAGPALQVICAWPVSGQYGPGSRILYYVLVAASVLARKVAWLRKASLAAALLFPAVAAVHGVLLAILSIDDAVDMDVYGAFQFCSIGILAAPVTARLSRTYFYDPGRNTIFVWTGMVLAGLLSLTVQFYRSSSSNCTHDDNGNPISPDPRLFPYGNENVTCGLVCDVTTGPFSPMRQGSANNIYVIPSPEVLTFGAATLLAAACCIPAILSLVSMWNKILEINWKERFGRRDEADDLNARIDGTNATVGRMNGINSIISSLLSTVEIPLFVAAVLAILIFGERNLWSLPVVYQTEPMASVGQWAPIVGAGLAALGSLSLILVKDVEAVEQEAKSNEPTMHHCNCSHHHHESESEPSSSTERDARDHPRDSVETPPQDAMDSPIMQQIGTGLFPSTSGTTELRPVFSNESQDESSGLARTVSRSTAGQSRLSHTGDDVGNRRKVAKTLLKIGNYIGNAAPDRFDDSEFRRGRAIDFPEIPGEEGRNPVLTIIREQYNPSRDADGNATPLRRSHSRAGSFISLAASELDIEGEPGTPGLVSPLLAQQPRSQSPSPSLTSRRPQINSLPTRRATLEVPTPTNHSFGQSSSPPHISPIAPNVSVTGEQKSPEIVISDSDAVSTVPTPPSTETDSSRVT